MGVRLQVSIFLCAFVATIWGQSQEANDVAVIKSNNDFGLKIYQILGKTPGNVFFSPYSASTALSMMCIGATGATFNEMVQGLSLPKDKEVIQSGYRSLIASVKKAGSANVTLDTANRIYVDQGIALHSAYQNDLSRYFQSEAINVNFKKDPEGARTGINKWVEEVTRNRIKDLLAEGTVTKDTGTVLVNAIYFNGNWSQQFPAENTKTDLFYTSCDSTTNVQMMQQVAQFRYAETPEYQALEMPYKGDEISMLVLLPKTCSGLNDLEASLSTSKLREINEKLFNRKVSVYLPKFTMEKSMPLNEILKQIGMNTMFTDEATFPLISETALKVSYVIQKSFVKVSEEGTEAAAATAVVGAVITSVQIPRPIPVFRADRSFVFLIRNKESGAVLFIGRYSAEK